MYEELSRVEMLRFARRVVAQQSAQQLAQLDHWIADAERAEVERQAREARRAAVQPGWILGLTDDRPDEVHVGGCTMAGQRRLRPIPREEACRLIVQQIAGPCGFCRPDTELGV
ncbi:DUF6233 domain-containing protein [Streptomyces arboris]|uniref:DUF6233 domain-containing protein n=1 Tax=Streptomyces arboris TaxID=2600619 RepID=UPI003BF51AD2